MGNKGNKWFSSGGKEGAKYQQSQGIIDVSSINVSAGKISAIKLDPANSITAKTVALPIVTDPTRQPAFLSGIITLVNSLQDLFASLPEGSGRTVELPQVDLHSAVTYKVVT